MKNLTSKNSAFAGFFPFQGGNLTKQIKNWLSYQRCLMHRYRNRKRWAVIWAALCLVTLLGGAIGTTTLEDYIDMEIVKNQDYYYHDDMQSYMTADNFAQLPADIMARANKDYLADFNMDEMHGYDNDKSAEVMERLLGDLKD